MPPDGGTHWSTRRVAASVGLSQSNGSRVWRAFGLQPHRLEHWKLSKDPLFVEKVRDIVGLYLGPPERAIVLCVDEKSQIQALDLRSAPNCGAARLPGALPPTTRATAQDQPVRGLDAASGKVIGSLHARHRAIEFKRFLATLEREVPGELEVAPHPRRLRHPQTPA